MDVIYKILKDPGGGGSSCGFFGNVFVPEQLNRSIAERLTSKSRYNIHCSGTIKINLFISFLFFLNISFQMYRYFFRSTLHVFDVANVSMSFNQIRNGNNSTLNEFRNYYLINVPEHYSRNSSKIEDYFIDVPLKFNSLTFAFCIEEIKGMKIKIYEFSKKNITAF